jgi:hypothetical protein
MNIQEAIDHPLVDYAREELWGSGVTTIPAEFENDFYRLGPEDQRLVRAFFLAATNACPVPITLAEDPEYGPAYQEVRYSSVGFWFRYFFLEEGLPLDHQTSIHRFGRGKQDENWVPLSKKGILEGPSAYAGYVTPRLVLDLINQAKAIGLEPIKVIDYLCRTNPDDDGRVLALILNAALLLEALGRPPGEIKQRLFDQGYRQEVPAVYWNFIVSQLNWRLPEELQNLPSQNQPR